MYIMFKKTKCHIEDSIRIGSYIKEICVKGGDSLKAYKGEKERKREKGNIVVNRITFIYFALLIILFLWLAYGQGGGGSE